MGMDPKEVAITMLVITILFHYFSYSFTIQAYDYSDYDISLDVEELYQSGIMIGEWDERNITYENTTWTEFDLNETQIRGRWETWTLTGKSALLFQSQSHFFDIPVWIDFRWLNIEGGLQITNQTMIARFDTDHNWTKIEGATGYVLFIRDPQENGNITDAVSEQGIVKLTIAEDVSWSEEPNVQSFISWYLGLVTGSENWGLPPSFGILVRLMTTIGMFAGIWLLVEARKL